LAVAIHPKATSYCPVNANTISQRDIVDVTVFEDSKLRKQRNAIIRYRMEVTLDAIGNQNRSND